MKTALIIIVLALIAFFVWKHMPQSGNAIPNQTPTAVYDPAAQKAGEAESFNKAASFESAPPMYPKKP